MTCLYYLLKLVIYEHYDRLELDIDMIFCGCRQHRFLDVEGIAQL